ncbi:MAG: SigE family RNA polymerase sigma factor [Propionibacteriales bacterium]|nr:SigE family RNA polymerase sigma factor [Propionibacteriales bacterium]
MDQSLEDDFRGWVSINRDPLRRTAFLLSGDWHLADDLVQEALTRAFSRWARITARGVPDAYVRKIVVNLSLDHRRRPSRREESQAEPPETRALSGFAETAAERDRVLAALALVPPGQRAVLVLRYFDDLSVEEAARVLRRSVGNVKSQSSRGLIALRSALEATDHRHTTRIEGS